MLEKKAEPQANVEKITSEEETKLQEKSKRTAEDIKKVFIETYGFEEDDPKLEKIVERELAHSKVVSKLIGQKVHWREKANQQPEKLVESEDKNDIRSMERTKAVEKVLSSISKKFNDLDTKEVFTKIKEVYKEKGDETLRGDFEKKLWQSFWVAYPDKYKEDVKEKVIKEKDDYSGDRMNSKPPVKPKTTERKFFVKSTPVKDWFTKK